MEMTPNNATVFNCSMERYNQLLRVYGTGSLAELTLIKLIYKYACYSPTENTLNRLDAMISYIQRANATICMDKIVGDFYPGYNNPLIPDEEEGDPIDNGNKPPTVDDKTINLDNVIYDSVDKTDQQIEILMYSFVKEDFRNNFSDPDGDGPGTPVINSLPSEGRLFYQGAEVYEGQLILNPSNLQYWLRYDEEVALSQTFNFKISDDNYENPAWSNEATITIERALSSNQPAEVGDNTVYVDNKAITVLIESMFTDGNPAYSDPESDPLDAIRVDGFNRSNQGSFKYKGNLVIAGQVITAAELAAGDFIHEGASINDISSDVIQFSVRDTGSMIWVN